MRVVSKIKRMRLNGLTESFLSHPASDACASLYSISGRGTHDIFRDLIVLKKYAPDEKGVILLKYARTFDAVIALFDVKRLMERYVFVLEPCWAGYCDPSILMFIVPGHPVVVQCFTEEDYQFIREVGEPLVPIRLGPADWVDADLFTPSQIHEKPYDLVMVANWAAHKRHLQLFHALNRIKDRKLRVLLIGFPWGGRTADDIKREAEVVQNDLIRIDILEQLRQSELVGYLNQCKVFVFLSRKEGDNKALVEAMFANVPAIVFDKTIGGASSRVTAETGIFSSDEALPENILYMVDHYREFHPRQWALRHTGSSVATAALNEILKRTNGFTRGVVEKINSPNLSYKDERVRKDFESEYHFISESLRRSVYRI